MQPKKQSEKERAKREALARKRRKKRRSAAFFLLFVLTVTGIALSLTVFFKIETVEVNVATSRYTKQEIAEAAGIKEGDNIFLFSTGRAAGKVETTLINLTDVKITRQLPNTVIIEGTELSQYAMLVYDGGQLAISSNLYIFSGDALPADGSMKVYGLTPTVTARGKLLQVEKEQQLNYEILQQLFESLVEQGLFNGVTEIDVSDRLNITLVYEGRIDVVFGTASELEYKVRMLKKMVDEGIAPDESGRLDLSIEKKAIFKPYS